MKIKLGHAHTVPKTDKRQTKWKAQRKDRGFDDTEIWGLDTTICQLLIPRLKVFKESNKGYPAELTSEKWDCLVQEMIDAFELTIKRDEKDLTNAEWKRIHRGLKTFAKYFLDLWT
jgi:hypothetical protein